MKFFFVAIFLFFLSFEFVSAQEAHAKEEDTHTQHGDMTYMKMPDQQEIAIADEFLMQQGSGTAVNPSSSPMHMSMFRKNGWNLMFHEVVYLNYTNQSGPRGNDKFFSTNWFMGMADRPLRNGRLMFRSMLSLEPATVREKSYPELFQTGETAFGRPLIDRQHPHDLFMELAAQYVYPVTDRTLLNIYFAPVGHPALGPVAYSHRVSAMELPQAPLSHHLQDSSHMAGTVLTGGIKSGSLELQLSGFHGAEPGEQRWDIDLGAIDSWATRLQFSPNPQWTAQFSIGRLKKPEQLEPGDVLRTTASATYNQPRPEGFWATSFIYGQNHKVDEKRTIRSFLLESLYQFHNKNYVTGRIEVVDKDELFLDSDDPLILANGLENQTFRIQSFTAGYSRNFNVLKGFETGLGSNITFYGKPAVLDPIYGKHPTGIYFYFRVRPEKHV